MDVTKHMDAKVLVVEDDPPVSLMLTKMLQNNHFQVIASRNGREGLRFVDAFDPELVITDIYMPEMDGIEFIRVLKRTHPTKRILAISGGEKFGSRDVIELAKILGADEGLRKPFRLDDFLATVQKCLGERRTHRRVRVLWSATLLTEEQRLPCTVLDLSLGGAKMQLVEPRPLEGRVTLLSDHFRELPAEVVWTQGKLFGVRFTEDRETVADAIAATLPV